MFHHFTFYRIVQGDVAKIYETLCFEVNSKRAEIYFCFSAAFLEKSLRASLFHFYRIIAMQQKYVKLCALKSISRK